MVLKAIADRRSIRDYKSDKIPQGFVIELIKAAQFAPSAKHNRSLQFIIIRDKKTKETIYGMLGQGFIKQAPLLIIPTVDTKKSSCPIQDLSVASENIFVQAAALSLGTVWKKVPEEKIEEVKILLDIPKNFMLINIIPVGFPKTKRRSHNEKDFDLNKIHFEKW